MIKVNLDKKLNIYCLIFTFLIIFFPIISISDVAAKDIINKWSCNSSNSTNTLCYLSTEKDKEFNELIGAIVKLKYTGETSNNLPNGKGKIIYNYIKISDAYESSLNEGYVTDSKEGIFKTSSDHKATLISGIKKMPDGSKLFIKNEETYRIEYSTGIIFEGKFFRHNEMSLPQILRGTAIYSTGAIKKFEGTFIIHKFNNIGLTHFRDGKVFYTNGDIYEGSFGSERNLNYRIKGTFYHSNGDRVVGTFYKNSGGKKEGTEYYRNGDKYIGTYFDKRSGETRKNGNYYFANGQIAKYKNGNFKNQKISQKTTKTKKKFYKSSDDSFIKSFVLSWVFAGFLWGIIIFYFKVLGSIGNIVKKIDKKIPGIHEIAIYSGVAITWYMAWALLYGFEAALLINFVFIYLAVWGSITVFFLNKISYSMRGKSGIYFTLFLGVCSLGLAVEMIGPFIKFLRNI